MAGEDHIQLTDGSMKHTTIIVGPDEQRYDLAELIRKTGYGFHARDGWIPINAYTESCDEQEVALLARRPGDAPQR